MNFLEQLIDNSQVQQRSDAWHKIRLGRFTSSEIWKICEFGKRDMTEDELAQRPKGSRVTKIEDHTILTNNGINYVLDKVAEILTGEQKASIYSYPIQWGIENEEPALNYFSEKMNVKIESFGFQEFGNHCGGSPDGIFLLDNERQGVEIKCPYSSARQIQYLQMKSVEELKESYPEYYWQCVSLMLFMDVKKWHFVTYDPRMKSEKAKMSHLIITEDEVSNDQEILTLGIQTAIKNKLEILTELL